MSLRAHTPDVDATKALGAALAEHLHAGDVVLLAGDLGAGKTAFTQGLGRGLGVEEQIVSPTFTLARHYRGRLDLHHLDVYRMERFSELADVGLAELVDAGGVVVIEWGDAVAPALANDYLEVALTYGAGPDDRTCELRCVGSRWAARERALDELLSSFATEGRR